jgi:hypothetical protein
MGDENLESRIGEVKQCMPRPMPYAPCMGPVVNPAPQPSAQVPSDRYEEPPESNSTYEESSPETSAYGVSPFGGIGESISRFFGL